MGLSKGIKTALERIRECEKRDPNWCVIHYTNPAICFRLKEDGTPWVTLEQYGEVLMGVEEDDLQKAVALIFLAQALHVEIHETAQTEILNGRSEDTGFTGVIIEGTEDLPS